MKLPQNNDSQNREFKGIWISREILELQDISPIEKLILATIDGLNKSGSCYANNHYFSKLHNLGKARISRIINQLKELDYIDSNVVADQGNKRYIQLNREKIYSEVIARKTEQDLTKSATEEIDLSESMSLKSKRLSNKSDIAISEKHDRVCNKSSRPMSQKNHYIDNNKIDNTENNKILNKRNTSEIKKDFTFNSLDKSIDISDELEFAFIEVIMDVFLYFESYDLSQLKKAIVDIFSRTYKDHFAKNDFFINSLNSNKMVIKDKLINILAERIEKERIVESDSNFSNLIDTKSFLCPIAEAIVSEYYSEMIIDSDEY